RSVPRSNVTVSVYEPSLLDCEAMYNMPSTPLTCCSIGAATVSATTTALPPGYEQETCTVGGEISGYWATGRLRRASVPVSVMTSDSTTAKIGRSMQKRESIGRVLSVLRFPGRLRRRHGHRLGINDQVGPDLLQHADHHAIVRLQTLIDD